MSGYPYRRPVGSYGRSPARAPVWPRQGQYFRSRPTVPALRTVEPSGPEPRLTLDLVALAPIFPAPTRDFRTFDFTQMIGDLTVPISVVTWECAVAPDSPVPDMEPDLRLLQDPTIEGQYFQQTSCLVGDMIEGVVYILTVQANFQDGRILVQRGSLPCVAETLPELPEPDPCVVPFDYDAFLTMFPEFVSLPSEQVFGYWVMACEGLRNDCSSPVQNLDERKELLLLLTAHFAALLGGPQGGGGFSPAMTGAITSKSVNGVSIGSSGIFPGVSGTQAYYMLTRYGQAYWYKIRAYRLFYYQPGFQRLMIAPFTSWPWTVGGMPGLFFGGGCGPCFPCGPPKPPEPPVPPCPDTIWVDSFSISGDGLSAATAFAVRTVAGEDYENGNGFAPIEIATPQTLYVDGISIVNDGLTPVTPLTVKIVAGAVYNSSRAIAVPLQRVQPRSVVRPGRNAPVWYVDGSSLVGDGLTPDTAYTVRLVEGEPFYMENGGNGRRRHRRSSNGDSY